MGGELIFTAAITAARTTVLLPDGWYPTGASEAAQVGTMAGGQAFVLLIAAFQVGKLYRATLSKSSWQWQARPLVTPITQFAPLAVAGEADTPGPGCPGCAGRL